MAIMRVGSRGELTTSTGICWGGVLLRLPDPRVTLTTTGVPNLGDSGGQYVARIVDSIGVLPPGLSVGLLWPGPMGHCKVGASLTTCGDAPCGIDIVIDGEMGELDGCP